VAVLSPHLDDAVLSCWHVLDAAGSVTVVNVFTGTPAAGSPVGWWDERTGAVDSTVRVRQRTREDRTALALAGRTAVNLDLLEAQYRGGPASAEAVATRIAPEVAECDTLYAPVVLGAHVDHVLVRDAALLLEAEGVRVRLYADLPHGLSRGWPTWVAPDGLPEVDETWEYAVTQAVPDRAPPRPHIHELVADDQRRKLVAVHAYRTQIAELGAMAYAPLDRSLRYEVTWDLAPP
jgi:LmbE family N-acetylglucosaminyl deacetylase